VPVGEIFVRIPRDLIKTRYALALLVSHQKGEESVRRSQRNLGPPDFTFAILTYALANWFCTACHCLKIMEPSSLQITFSLLSSVWIFRSCRLIFAAFCRERARSKVKRRIKIGVLA
jgi:hypothetical protein